MSLIGRCIVCGMQKPSLEIDNICTDCKTNDEETAFFMDYLNNRIQVSLVNSIKTENDNNSGWQKCPKCDGDGIIVVSDILISKKTCHICNGTGLINLKTGLPPKK